MQMVRDIFCEDIRIQKVFISDADFEFAGTQEELTSLMQRRDLTFHTVLKIL